MSKYQLFGRADEELMGRLEWIRYQLKKRGKPNSVADIVSEAVSVWLAQQEKEYGTDPSLAQPAPVEKAKKVKSVAETHGVALPVESDVTLEPAIVEPEGESEPVNMVEEAAPAIIKKPNPIPSTPLVALPPRRESNFVLHSVSKEAQAGRKK